MQPPTTGSRGHLTAGLMAGSVFLWEGLLKFTYANQGVGRLPSSAFPGRT